MRAIATPRQPIEVVVDRHGDLPTAARVLADGEVIVVTATRPAASLPDNVQVMTVPDRDGRIDLRAMAAALGAREINELHVEAGAKLNGAMLAAGIVDEILLYVAPCLLGDPARGMFALPALPQGLDERVSLKVRSIDAVGGDWRIVARVELKSA